uniref:Uncharacterized protein n=1 Tax=Cucumis melo TaxID=3656 RepID=A0A9I9E250_CUCME
ISTTQFSYRGVKSDPAKVSLFCIGHKCFQLRDSYSDDFSLHSWHCPSLVFPRYRLESELVGGRTKVQHKTIDKMAKLHQRVANARPVLETT